MKAKTLLLAIATALVASAAFATIAGTVSRTEGGNLNVQGTLAVSSTATVGSGVSFSTATTAAGTCDATGSGATLSDYCLSGGDSFFTLYGNQSDSATAKAVVSDSLHSFTTLGSRIHVFRNNGTDKAAIGRDGELQQTGIATASLPSCAAGQMAGAILYDTTVSRHALCDNQTGAYAWRYVVVAATSPAVTEEANFTAVNFAAPVSTDVSFVGGYYNSGGQSTLSGNVRISCGQGTVGVTGGAATGVVVQLWNLTNANEACSCTLSGGTATCSAAVGTQATCTCNAQMTNAKAYTVRLKSTTDCGTNPGQMVCTVYYQKPLATGTQLP